jgi:hexosaminidase
MRRSVNILVCTLYCFVSSSLQLTFASPQSTNQYNLIPYPNTLIPKTGYFSINSKTQIACNTSDTTIMKLVRLFIDNYEAVSGNILKITDVKRVDTNKVANTIYLHRKKIRSSSKEAYILRVSEKEIHIDAASPNGFFYAFQTLYQLLPPDFLYKHVVTKSWRVSNVVIIDEPRFSYRGMHLDVSRHLFPVSFIKKYIDLMAMHKYNVFHWHLTDDQGWRLEIKKYPKLTEVGSKREQTLVGYFYERFPQVFDGIPYGGYYTQEDAKEIVKYAADRFITVIPEIELPGHAQAAIASYPYLSCTRDSTIKVYTVWGISKDVYCTRDTVFNFLENVLSEVMDIFPSKLIHIGGDECLKDRWKTCPDCQARINNLHLKNEKGLQSYFVQRIEKYLNSRGRQIIGWDEILEGGLAPNATVMSWRGTVGGITAAKAKHDVIMTPGTHCYFDKYQTDPTVTPNNQPTAIGGYLPMKMVYDYEPIPKELSENESRYIKGAQANVWTEYMTSPEHVEYMVYPRAAAMAEVLWTNPEIKNWDRFRNTMLEEFKRYEVLGVNASHAFEDVKFESKVTEDNKLEIKLSCEDPRVDIHYCLKSAKVPSLKDSTYKSPIILTDSTDISVSAYIRKEKIGDSYTKTYLVSKLTGMDYAKNGAPNMYDGGNLKALTDGVRGTNKVTSQWVGVGKGTDGEVIVDLKDTKHIHKFSVGLLNAPSLCAFITSKMELYGSLDGKNYMLFAEKDLPIPVSSEWQVFRPTLEFPLMQARYLKLVMKKSYTCAASKLDGNDGRPIIFMDEITAW